MTVDALVELERLIEGLSPAEVAELDELLKPELSAKWLPSPGPQTEAYYSKADLLLYGGAAGGGKSDVLLGLALQEHQRSVIFRRAYVDLRGLTERLVEINGTRQGYNDHDKLWRGPGQVLEFGALEKPGSEQTWQGRAHDFIGFDEGAQLSSEKIAFVIGWLRSTDKAQRKRVVIASNPPIGGDGDWMLEWFAPWLDPLFSKPARPGELRWAIIVGVKTIWVDGPEPHQIEDKTYTPISRTFIPAKLSDNPYLRDTEYRTQLENLPEPLRSQLLHGDFLAGREDHAWQVIPTAWVLAANERWRAAEQKRRAMITLAADVGLGGGDPTVFAALHADAWFAPLIRREDAEAKEEIPALIAAQMLMIRRDGADLSVDGTGGWGSGVRSHLSNNHSVECASVVFSAGSNRRTKDGKLGFKNLRADMYWGFREALDPDDGDEIKLPPDARLTAQLTAARYTLKGTDILIEDKDEIRSRLGSSPDDADAVVIAWHRRRAAVRKAETEKTKKKLPLPAPRGGWMGR